MGAPWCGRWQPPPKPAYGGLQTEPLARRHNTAALPCKATRGYAD